MREISIQLVLSLQRWCAFRRSLLPAMWLLLQWSAIRRPTTDRISRGYQGVLAAVHRSWLGSCGNTFARQWIGYRSAVSTCGAAATDEYAAGRSTIMESCRHFSTGHYAIVCMFRPQFNASRPTQFIIHGWLSTPDMFNYLRDALLQVSGLWSFTVYELSILV